MKTLMNIGCLLIGWDKNILSECGEASHRQFRKLISALSIMLILWGTIGYCFADRYINLDSCLLKICVSLVFMFIVLSVESDYPDSRKSATDDSNASDAGIVYGFLRGLYL